MGRADIDYSDQPHGKVTLLKIIGNTFILNMVETLSDGHTLTDKNGLGNHNLHQFIETMFPDSYPRQLMGGVYYKREEPLFAVDLAPEDARHALDIAATSGTKIKDVEVTDGHLPGVQKHMSSRGDVAGIYGAVSQEAGLKSEN